MAVRGCTMYAIETITVILITIILCKYYTCDNIVINSASISGWSIQKMMNLTDIIIYLISIERALWAGILLSRRANLFSHLVEEHIAQRLSISVLEIKYLIGISLGCLSSYLDSCYFLKQSGNAFCLTPQNKHWLFKEKQLPSGHYLLKHCLSNAHVCSHHFKHSCCFFHNAGIVEETELQHQQSLFKTTNSNYK